MEDHFTIAKSSGHHMSHLVIILLALRGSAFKKSLWLFSYNMICLCVKYYLEEKSFRARASLTFRHFPYSALIEFGGSAASIDLEWCVMLSSVQMLDRTTCAGAHWLGGRWRTRSRWWGSSWRCRSPRCRGPASRRRGRGCCPHSVSAAGWASSLHLPAQCVGFEPGL